MRVGYKILVLGDIYDNHIVRYLYNLKQENPKADIDVFAYRQGGGIDPRLTDVVNQIYWHIPTKNIIKYYNSYALAKRYKSELRSISKENHYDIVNIHYTPILFGLIMSIFHHLGDTILVTPWGSDFYMVGKIGRLLLKPVFKKADYICSAGNRFAKDLIKYYHIPDSKLICLDIGSETIDYISDNKGSFSVEQARKELGLDGDYFITCGYNAHKEQQHLSLIEAISEIRKNLPEKLTLLFPVTYPQNKEYIDIIKQEAAAKSLRAVFFETYLDVKTLFLLRLSTDMFVHVQTTDANSASVQEYLLLQKNVVNGSWLRYEELEKYGIPYYLADNLESLSQIILDAYKKGPINVAEATVQYIESYGWKQWIKKWNIFFCQCVSEKRK